MLVDVCGSGQGGERARSSEDRAADTSKAANGEYVYMTDREINDPEESVLFQVRVFSGAMADVQGWEICMARKNAEFVRDLEEMSTENNPCGCRPYITIREWINGEWRKIKGLYK